jgi:para-nitrobenzyl esterase
MMKATFLGAAILILCGAHLAVTVLFPSVEIPSVTTMEGNLEGARFGTTSEVAFLGIPYAAPPVGDLRWKPPHPASMWPGTRKAAAFGPSCAQDAVSWTRNFQTSEDCLYLNVWTTQLSTNAKLPVMVWIHGGGNKNGRGDDPPLGPVFARRGVVVVSLNYRLGPIGFFAHPALTAESPHHASGEYGLLDQIAALEWVRRNIAQFGGDPEHVTIWGESAGAADACLLIASPLATGLFERAILESGDCQGTLMQSLKSPVIYNFIGESGENQGLRLAHDLAIPDGPESLTKLRAVSADEILKHWKDDPDLQTAEDVDGWVIPEQPTAIFASGKQAHIPVIVGSNADDGSMFAMNPPKTVAAFEKALRGDTGKHVAEELQAYHAASDADVARVDRELQTDYFGYGAYSFAKSMARAGQNAYLYNFSFVNSGSFRLLGAFHGEELQFLSGAFWKQWVVSPDDEKVSDNLRHYWLNFAKTGNPNGEGLPNWPVFDARLNQCLDIGREVKVAPVPHAVRIAVLERIMQEIFAETISR